VEEGAEKSNGPGLLQNKEKYYQYHQEAIEAMWAQLKDSIGGVFGKAEFVPFEEIISNPKYIELTTYAPVKMMGLSMMPGADNVYPKESRYVSSYDKNVMAALFEPLGAEFLLIFDNQAAVRFTKNDVSIGGLALRRGCLALTTKITLYHKTDGYGWSTIITTTSDSDSRIIDHELNPDTFPKLLLEAQAKLWKNIRDEVDLGKKKAAEGVIK
jgi:hypothetical protein